MMGATDLLFITISRNVSFIGKTWWVLMLVLRALCVLLAGVTLFSDEQERFICNTIQPGCSNLCFDAFSPVSVLRLWFFQLLLLCVPNVLFATHVLHRLASDRSRGGSPENSSSSRELSLLRAPLQDLPRGWGAPRFSCSYLCAVILRVLLEVAFGAVQFFLFGLSVPKSVLCYEAPCTSGVECYISRPTEKTWMLNLTLGASSLSALLSLADLASSTKAMVRWRRTKRLLMEELSKGERSSVFTATTVAEEHEVLPTRRISPSGGSTEVDKEEQQAAGELLSRITNGGPVCKTSASTNDTNPGDTDVKADVPPPPPPPGPFVLHSHLRPPLSPRPDRAPLSPRVPPTGVKKPQCDGSERAWV